MTQYSCPPKVEEKDLELFQFQDGSHRWLFTIWLVVLHTTLTSSVNRVHLTQKPQSESPLQPGKIWGSLHPLAGHPTWCLAGPTWRQPQPPGVSVAITIHRFQAEHLESNMRPRWRDPEQTCEWTLAPVAFSGHQSRRTRESVPASLAATLHVAGATSRDSAAWVPCLLALLRPVISLHCPLVWPLLFTCGSISHTG